MYSVCILLHKIMGMVAELCTVCAYYYIKLWGWWLSCVQCGILLHKIMGMVAELCTVYYIT